MKTRSVSTLTSDTSVGSAVSTARRLGFTIGRRVAVGAVIGTIIGYNIAGYGPFVGRSFPLVVDTGLGIAKCSPDELILQ